MKSKTITIIIDQDVVDKYTKYYFENHPKAHVPPIKQPYHESINQWMIMKRAAMNGLKQKWKNFIKWLVADQGYSDLRIERCEIEQRIYYPTARRHDIDNSVPKFILDGLVESGMIVDDDCRHIYRLTLECYTEAETPRTELRVKINKE